MAAAMPMAANMYGLICRNRNPRYLKSRNLPLSVLREMP